MRDKCGDIGLFWPFFPTAISLAFNKSSDLKFWNSNRLMKNSNLISGDFFSSKNFINKLKCGDISFSAKQCGDILACHCIALYTMRMKTTGWLP